MATMEECVELYASMYPHPCSAVSSDPDYDPYAVWETLNEPDPIPRELIYDDDEFICSMATRLEHLGAFRNMC